MSALRKARRLLNRWQPDVVVGSNGYAAAPAIRAALAMGTPVVLIEYNARPTRLTDKFANRAAVVSGGFDSLLPHLSEVGSVQIVGNPIRAAFARVFRRRLETLTYAKNRSLRRALVVLAGTAGSSIMNEVVPKGLYKVRSELANWRVIHQSGRRDRKRTALLYQKLGIPAEVTSYIPDMPRVLLAADVAIARAGAVTLSELAAAGVPSVLLPLPKPEDGHQAANAGVFTTARACRAVHEEDNEGRLDDRLASSLADMLASSSLRSQMSASMLALARPNAAAQVASRVLELARQPTLQGVA
jgi:UDP-N-acetylglucosamine--N-acetylmuramyl-(pentapeptide) pyrophosphoryl-undecaprenol N-acetylglucosamine transferase